MNVNKLAIVTAVTAALGGASGIASATITGVPSEAVLVPMTMAGPAYKHDCGDSAGQLCQSVQEFGLGVETYIGLYVPDGIGQDTVINRYTAPNVPTPATQVAIAPYPPTSDEPPYIYWTWFDEDSEKIEDGKCYISSGDYVLWTTDKAVQRAQNRQDAAMERIGGLADNGPSHVCGPSKKSHFGYVVFQTAPGADGQDADIAFYAHASIADWPGYLRGGWYAASIGSVPAIPMADGADPLPSGSGTPALFNEVIASGQYGDFRPAEPSAYAPIAAGIRMNNADGDDDVVRIEAPIQGPQAYFGLSLHAFWFDRNDPGREAQTIVWDDHEGDCSEPRPLPRELNVLLYNHKVNLDAGFNEPSRWGNLLQGRYNVGNYVTDVISAVDRDSQKRYDSASYCSPDYWLRRPAVNYRGAIAGYVNYEIVEIGEPVAAGDGVNSAAVAFNWQENYNSRAGLGWSTHMSTDLGKFEQ